MSTWEPLPNFGPCYDVILYYLQPRRPTDSDLDRLVFKNEHLVQCALSDACCMPRILKLIEVLLSWPRNLRATENAIRFLPFKVTVV
jgi:hypothetical protein